MSESQSTTTVVMGCKLPNGLIIEHGGRRFTLKGSNAARIVGGYGLTEGVPKDFAEAWLKSHADLGTVKNGLVFIQTSESSAKAAAKERRDVKTGLEPIDPLKAPPGIDVDKAAQAALRKQQAENPDRNRQQVE